MSPALADAALDLPQLLRAHAILSGAAVGLAILAGLPLAWWAARVRPVRVPLLAAAGLIQTVPTLALLALFYPALLLIGSATRLPVPALGFLPALLALTLYALLPILRNGVAGLTGLDRSVLEAADAVGMTGRQRLLQVELPLSAPVLLAGIRTAAIWTIGAATLATTVGQPSLGNLIFSGLQTENWVRVLVGCGAAAALAILVDALLAMVESGVAKRSPARMAIAATLLVLGAALALMPAAGGASERRPVVVGAKNFAEQYILANAMAQRLGSAGFPTLQREDLGSAVAYRALAAGDIDVYVDYSGTLWANVLGRSDTPSAATMRAELVRRLRARDGVTLLGPLGFENAYVLAMRRSRAEALGVRTIDDLARRAPRLRLASDIEFLGRPEWRALRKAYDLRFADARAYSPTFMYRAIADGSADVISAFSSDGRIAALDLVVLEDPRGALPNYDAVLLLSPRAAADPDVVAALRPLIGAIDVRHMREANLTVDRDVNKSSPAEAAKRLLEAIVP
ncbi:ABC transporter permease/substrate-binding protein [Sphingosinicella sp. BN140058]|uniref:ABC transporter permease/substrate-binding protein n=1 Tax=Sphingosinicella sp. BN140058 TaxID=1892855 RepID=UPI001011CBEE|nr:ABC transporter permease/substrate-binding protein [Sphingosinicella sp. BN140058]QAY76247.1 ABC transporter permease subunit [Sphingosinicella sp. BN140058]